MMPGRAMAGPLSTPGVRLVEQWAYRWAMGVLESRQSALNEHKYHNQHEILRPSHHRDALRHRQRRTSCRAPVLPKQCALEKSLAVLKADLIQGPMLALCQLSDRPQEHLGLCRASKLPEQYIPEISEALKKAGLKWEDFKVTDNTCGPHPPQESLAEEVCDLEQQAMQDLYAWVLVMSEKRCCLAEALQATFKTMRQSQPQYGLP